MQLHQVKSLLAVFTVSAVSLMSHRPAISVTVTIGGYTWDDANSFTNASIVQGNIVNQPLRASGFGTNSNAAFNVNASVGKLLGLDPQFDGSVAISFPDATDTTSGAPKPNVDRTTIQLNWGGRTLVNQAGNDFVVYETGSASGPEGFSVSVRTVGSSTLTTPRYNFPTNFDSTNSAFATPFDLSSFGLASDAEIDAIQITNLFNSSAISGADKVSSSSGEGFVLYPGDAGYSSGFTIVGGPLASNSNSEYATSRLDTDLVYVGVLNNLEPLPVPFDFSPNQGVLIFLIWRTAVYLKEKRKQSS